MLSDLANMNPDGTFVFQDINTPVDKTTAADLYRVFSNKTTDSRGREKDLRHTSEQIAAIGTQEQTAPRSPPRYDPVTGELIRPLQFKDEQPVPVLSIGVEADPSEVIPLPVIPIPVPIKAPIRSLAYAVGDARKRVTLKTLALELLMPANTVVMFFVLLLYVLGYFTTMGVATYTERFVMTVWPFLIVNLPMWLVLSHAGCVIEDTGPDAIDELPRPLRNFAFSEDILTPLFRMLLAILICFTPMVLLYRNLDPANPMTLPIVLTFALVGAFLFPAIALTTVTGTTILNLRPDRVGSVIKQCGIAYPASVILFLLAAIPSTYYIAGELLFRLVFVGPFFERINSPVLMLPLMMVSVYLLHFFCWHLGMMYRANHDQFPWLAQRHVKTDRRIEAGKLKIEDRGSRVEN